MAPDFRNPTSPPSLDGDSTLEREMGNGKWDILDSFENAEKEFVHKVADVSKFINPAPYYAANPQHHNNQSIRVINTPLPL